MEDELQTRTEHSRSLEDAEKFKAIDTLTSLGMLIPVSQIETFHGRVGNTFDAPWSVDANFNNASNSSNNNNVNARPTLYASDQQVAKEFAHHRGREAVMPVFPYDEFDQKVKNYTPQERLAWLAKLNKKSQDDWNNMTPQMQAFYKPEDTAKVYTQSDLDDASFIRREALTLLGNMSIEEQQAIWNKVSPTLRAELYEITSNDTDASIFVRNFDSSKLNEDDKKKYTQAIQTLLIPITEGSPVDFDARQAVDSFAKTMEKLQKPLIQEQEISEIARAAGVDEKVTLQLASAYNTRQLIPTIPKRLINSLLSNSSDIITEKLNFGNEEKEIPINLEYLQRFLHNAHIVGVTERITSSTLNKAIEAVSFFDLNKIGSKEQLERQRNETHQKIGGLTKKMPELPKIETATDARELLEILADAHAKPEMLVAAAKKLPGYEAIFDADAGNWEGFTLAEHTETVLRNFDENFADTAPVDLLAPLRLALLVHDIGKPIAAANGEKHKQKDYNVVQAADFLDKMGANPKLKQTLVAMIGAGMEYAFQMMLQPKNQGIKEGMRMLAKQTLSKNALERYFGSNDVTEPQIEAFTQACKILQLCDGGAYTSMAVTRKEGKGRHRNAPSFNGSFAHPVGLGKRDIRPREPGKPAAAADLTPIAVNVPN